MLGEVGMVGMVGEVGEVGEVSMVGQVGQVGRVGEIGEVGQVSVAVGAVSVSAAAPWSPGEAWALRGLAAGLVLLGWFMQFGWTAQPVFALDDAYITLTNVTGFMTGKSAYATPPLVGATSVVHFLLVWALVPVVGPTMAVALSCAVGALLYAFGLVSLCRAIGVSPVLAGLLLFVGNAVGLSQLQLFSGLETGLAMGAVAWALVFVVQRRGRALAVVCGLLPWVRPDLAPLSVLCLLAQGRDARGRWWPPLLRGVAIAVLVAAPFAWFAHAQTGQFVAGTASAKHDFFAEGCLPLRIQLGMLHRSLAPFVRQSTLLCVAVLLARPDRLTAVCLGFIAVFLGVYTVNFPGGLDHNHNRYLYPLVPLLVALLASGLAPAPFGLRPGPPSGSRAACAKGRAGLAASAGWRKAFALVLLVGSAGIGAARDLPASGRLGAADRAATSNTLAPLAEWLRNHTPADALILVHDAGYLAWKSDRRLEDMVGLKSPEVVELHRRLTFATCGLGRASAIARIVERDRPDYVVVLQAWETIFHLTASFPTPTSSLQRVYDQPGGYSVYRVVRRATP